VVMSASAGEHDDADHDDDSPAYRPSRSALA
jgi:hypothetical protein